MIYIFIISLLLFPLMWILLVPFNLVINTDNNIYGIYLPGIIKLSLIRFNEIWKINVRILLFNVKLKNKHSGKEIFKYKRKYYISDKSLFLKNSIKVFGRYLKSFKIKKLKADIDTGDFIYNAYLYPAVQVLGLQKNISINFNSLNKINLNIKGQLFSLVICILQFYIKNKKLLIKN